MTDTLFEQLGGTYTQTGDYLLPDLSLPAEKDNRSIGIWGQRRLRHLKQYHKAIYSSRMAGRISAFFNSALAYAVKVKYITARTAIKANRNSHGSSSVTQ